MQLSEDPRFLGQGQAFREEGGWRRGAKGKRDHLGRGGVGQGECQRGAIQSGIQTGGTGGSSAWLARGGHCPDFRRDYLSLHLSWDSHSEAPASLKLKMPSLGNPAVVYNNKFHKLNRISKGSIAPRIIS